jgi:hypothetical protein
MILILFILISYGISNIMVFSSIFKVWRNFWVRISPNIFGELFTCMICLPVWVGIIISFLGMSPTLHYFDTPTWLGWILDGFLASGGVWLLHTLQESLEKKNEQ